MHRALKTVLHDENANQKGSNITEERLRFDFTFPRALTPDEIKQVEDLVNEAIKADVEITCEEMTVDEAKSQGAIGLFTAKYGEKVKVYTMGKYSKEICGGPHAKRTGELGHFKIVKEQSSSAGVRRIKAILE
jgi:alanyl-tRNA synthetase